MFQKEIDTRRALDIMKTLPPEIRNRIFYLIEDAALLVAPRNSYDTACATTQLPKTTL